MIMDSVICKVCCKRIRHGQLTVFCSECKRSFHHSCINLSKDEAHIVNTRNEPWLCVNCICVIFPFSSVNDDNEFVSLVDSSNHESAGHNMSSGFYKPSSDLYFQFPLLPDSKTIINNEDLDPDINYFNALQIPKSQYVTSEELKTVSSKIAYSNIFSVFHANCRSLHKNFNNLLCTISAVEPMLSVIGVSETWLSQGLESLYDIPGYSFIARSRALATGGGVGLYIHEKYAWKPREDLNLDSEDTDSIFVELKDLNIIMGCIYRRPGTDMKTFNSSLDKSLTKINNERKIGYILGDYNINILKYSAHADTHNFLDCLFSNMFLPTVSYPTRITESSATLIDNIITNAALIKPLSCIVFSDISDHLPVYLSTDLNMPKVCKPDHYFKRSFNEPNTKKFIDDIQQINWNLYSSDFNLFSSKISETFDVCFPLVKYNLRNKTTPRKPWMTKGLARCCAKKEKLYKKFIKNPSDSNSLNYKSYRNKLNKLIRITEKNYYTEQFLEATSNMKKTWKIIKSLISKNNFGTITESFVANGVTITDKALIVNKFNDFFVNVGPTLASKINPTPASHKQFLSGDYLDSFALFLTTPEEVIKITNELANKTSAGYDNISVSIIKKVIPYLAGPLSELINKSFETGIVPERLKIARVCPVFKSGDSSDFTNYRPISVLPSLSKIFEKIVHNRLMTYLDKHSILITNQFGFRRNSDSSLAVVDMVDRITEQLDANCHSLGLFIDLSKAFDTLDHTILIDKLEFYGIRGIALNWFKSYLKNRSQYVDYNGTQSTLLKIRTGVPQGSILGPLLFLIYINDIINASKYLHLILFADDTNVFFHHKDLNALQDITNSELNKLSNWFRANRLSLNVKKTNYIIFSPKCKQSPLLNSFTIQIDGRAIERVTHARFLGVYIDEKLKWDKHVQQILTKISKNTGILIKLGHLLSTPVLLQLYNTLILPYLNYCNIVWGSAPEIVLNKLHVLQKKAMRIVDKTSFRAHSDPIFKKHRVLNIKNIRRFQILIFMFKFIHGFLPDTFLNYFKKTANVHSYNTRYAASLSFAICFAKTNRRKNTVKIIGPYLWNNLPDLIKQKLSFYGFKLHLKRYLLQNF